MKKEPCIRLGMRIRPKIKEKPDDSRNRSPPRARLLIARIAACAAVIWVNIEKQCLHSQRHATTPTHLCWDKGPLHGHGGTPSPQPNSGLPEFGHSMRWPKSETSDFGWGEGAGRACGITVHSRNGNEPESPQQNGSHLFQILRRRIIARIDRLRQEPLLVVGPELTDIRVGLDDGIDELSALALALADKDVADDIAVAVEANRPARRVDQ